MIGYIQDIGIKYLNVVNTPISQISIKGVIRRNGIRRYQSSRSGIVPRYQWTRTVLLGQVGDRG